MNCDGYERIMILLTKCRLLVLVLNMIGIDAHTSDKLMTHIPCGPLLDTVKHANVKISSVALMEGPNSVYF